MMDSRRLENTLELSQLVSMGWYVVMLVGAAGVLAACLWNLCRLIPRA